MPQDWLSSNEVLMRITSYEDLADIIGRIYDCSLDASRWPETLGFIVAATGANCGQIGVQDPVKMQADFAVEWGVTPEFARLYAEKFVSICPFLLTPYFVEVGGIISVSEMIDRAEFQSSRFYREWCRPQLVEDFLAGIIMKSASSYGGFSLSFPRVVDDDAKRMHALLLPHVARSVTIGRLLSGVRSEASALETTINALSTGVLFLDTNGQILRSNPAADRLVDDGSVIRRSRTGKLSAAHPSTETLLNRMLTQLSEGGAALSGSSIALRRYDGANGLIGHLLPVDTSTRMAALNDESDPAFILFIQRPGAQLVVPGKAFVDLYGITAGELRVLTGLLRGQTAQDVASLHGISVVTVRTHIRSLLAKTGTNRQADLLLCAKDLAPALLSAQESPPAALN
ncbi:helix-turn-helix transcriptional regulator [Devosia submarina]|uniref:helix-turn-helix transcriptional regulator n=1 Tax=Devosia submarina TaxID=1173082 RepID=UPI0013003B8E|nr:LuxR C-terminal-related transcriptional regulator [Devosia submarina]